MLSSISKSIGESSAWNYKKGAKTQAAGADKSEDWLLGDGESTTRSYRPDDAEDDGEEEVKRRSPPELKTMIDENGDEVPTFDCCGFLRPSKDDPDTMYAKVFGRPECVFCCTCTVDDSSPKDVYDAYQQTLQTYLTITTLLMGFIVTGAFISVAWSDDATFAQGRLVSFVERAMQAFGLALASFALTLAISLIAQQILSTRNLAACAVKFFKIVAPCMFVSEVLMYGCAFVTTDFLRQYLDLNYVTPEDALCTGNKVGGRGDSFCAQLGNDMHQAALELPQCVDTTNQYKYQTDEWLQAKYARPFKVYTEATPEDRERSVCNQLDWFAFQDPGHAKVKLHFGYMAYGPDKAGWRSKAFVDGPTTPVASAADFEDETIVENNGKLLGEAMCGKNVAANDMKNVCTKECEQDEITKEFKDCNDQRCDTAKTAYIAADNCADGKFKDTMKCYRTCDWGLKGPSKDQFNGSFRIIKVMQWGLAIFIFLRIILFVPWWFYQMCMMGWEFHLSLGQALGFEGDMYQKHVDEDTMSRRQRSEFGAITNLTVENLNVRNDISARELVGPPIIVPPLRPPPPPRVLVEQTPMTKIGVDLNHDGRPDIYYVGADRNHDGVPDALQGGSGLLTSAAGFPSSRITSSASYSETRPFTSGAVV